MIRTLLKLALMLVSYFGWWEFFRGRCRVNVYFAPLFTLAFQFAVLFLPGLLNFLPEAAWALYFGGFLCLAEGLRREKLGLVKHYFNWGYGLFFLALAVMAVAFRGKVVTWFDNFTHWATVVKNMIAAERFPTFAQEAVSFHTYPLGSAALIWYFSRITSDQEDFWMLAQGFMMLCTLLPMFAFGKKNSFRKAVFLALAGNFLLCYNIPPTELLVDTLLPLAGTAMLLFLHSECLREEQPLNIWFALPLLFWVMNIKNAGMLFAAAGMLILLLRMKKQGRELKPLLLMGLVLLAGYLLWDRHCDYVFYSSVSQHEISAEYLSSRLGEKTLADIGTILFRMAKALIVRPDLACLLAVLAVPGVLTWALVPEKKKEYVSMLRFLAISWVVYGISLMAMYVTSMSLEGALELQSADRYIRIWEIVAYYLAAVSILELVPRLGRESVVSLALVAAMAALWLGYYGMPMTIVHEQRNDPAARRGYEAPIWEYGVARGRSYLICAQDDVYWYPAFLWGYHLDSNRFLQIRVTEAADMEAEKYYDYVVILDEDNPVIEAWVAEHYPDQAGRTVIQCFK